MRVEDWNKLEELGFLYIGDGKWKKGKNIYIKKESCGECGKPFLTQNSNGQYCDRKCSNVSNKSITIEKLQNLFKKEGYKLLTKEYKNNKQKINYICPNGHKHFTYINNWRKGCRCGYCTGKYKLYVPDIIKEIEKEGYTVITKEIKDSKQKLHLKCSNGHDLFVSWDNFNRNYTRCTCHTNSSPCEMELYNYLKAYNPVLGNRNIIKYTNSNRYLELDIYFPELHKAIEFNGDYWHCNPSKYDRNYYHKNKNMKAYQIWDRDIQKRILCMEKGIDLMVVWENEWNNNKEHIKQNILDWLGR